MRPAKITETIKQNKTLISDGAWGTFLQKKGLQPGQCPELWCLDHPEKVLQIAQSYITAGSDMIQTNSFGSSRFKLEHFHLADKTYQINKAAAQISRSAAGDNHWVIASVGPTGKMLLLGDITAEQLYDAFKEQAVALAEGGADAICIETMSATDEAALAVKAAKENTDCEVICTFTFEFTAQGDYRTMMGINCEQAVSAALEAGADIIGSNCGNGIDRMIEIVHRIKAVANDTPILVHANAGLPKNVDGIDIFPETPEDMAAKVPALIKAGANIIGGCCGTTPQHIAAIKNAIQQK